MQAPPKTRVNPETYTVSFKIVDSDENPIQGATVTFNSKTSTSGSAGGCNIQNVPTGSYEYTVTATGYTTSTGSVTVPSEETIIVTLN